MPIWVRTVALIAAALVAMTLAGCTTSHRTPTNSSTPSVQPNYRARLLARPLHLPAIRHGDACPTSGGSPIATADFTGIAQGPGPVHPLGADARGIAQLVSPTRRPGWLAFKTLWISEPRYTGPFLVRVRRIDGTGLAGVLANPLMASFYVPTGATANGVDGYREQPGATWVKQPGCLAWQVDGIGFSHVIVVRAVCRPPECTMPWRPHRP